MHFSPPKFIKRLLPELIWDLKGHSKDKTVYLTFDDGPTPEITLWILDVLDKYNIKATFFCLAKNVDHHPELLTKILDRGHRVGNHTYSHQKGWQMETGQYIEDVDLADRYLSSNLFRPPYGRIKPSQARRLSERYKIIMWTIISHDYSRYCTPRKCYHNVVDHCSDGAIVVFHDSQKAYRNMSYALPRTIEKLRSEGYSFGVI